MFAMRCRNVDNIHVVVTQELLVGIRAFADPEVATESDRAILLPRSNRHDSLVRIGVQRGEQMPQRSHRVPRYPTSKAGRRLF
jgi:hypothetical protein